MAVERTLCIVKPDAVEKRKAGAILARIEEGGFRIVALRMTHLSRPVAEGFYEVHRQRPFFGELVQFMTRSPVVIAVLERDNAVDRLARPHGRDRPGQGRRRDHPQAIRRRTWARTRPTARTRSTTRKQRDRVLLSRGGGLAVRRDGGACRAHD